MEEGYIIALTEKMQECGITKKELADMCGYPEGYVDRIMEGRIQLRLEPAANMAAALGMSLDAVCGIIIR